MKHSHTELTSNIRGVQHAFMEILENDRDMALMALSKVREHPELYNEEDEEDWEGDHEEIELLIENYLQSVDGIYNQALIMGEEIDSAMSLLMIRLDSSRNHLMKIDIYISVVTAVAGICSFFAGVFGMNLNSGISEDPRNMLWIIGGGLATFGCVSIFSIISYMKRRGWLF